MARGPRVNASAGPATTSGPVDRHPAAAGPRPPPRAPWASGAPRQTVFGCGSGTRRGHRRCGSGASTGPRTWPGGTCRPSRRDRCGTGAGRTRIHCSSCAPTADATGAAGTRVVAWRRRCGAVRHRDRVLTCTHLGGHRFAPTALLLPAGALHGRLDEASATDLVAQAHAGRTPSASLRGFSSLDEPAQVADAHARLVTGYDGLTPLRVDLDAPRVDLDPHGNPRPDGRRRARLGRPRPGPIDGGRPRAHRRLGPDGLRPRRRTDHPLAPRPLTPQPPRSIRVRAARSRIHPP